VREPLTSDVVRCLRECKSPGSSVGPAKPDGCTGPTRAACGCVGVVTWGADLAEVYDAVYAAASEPSVLEPQVGLLADLAQGGRALEFGIGTGLVALPLRERGVVVEGIELSEPMAERLRAKPGGQDVPVTIGSMTTTRVTGTFTLVYVVANTIMNVTTQDEQLAVLMNAAAHLEGDGRLLVAVVVPQLRKFPLGENARVFTLQPAHVGIETLDDVTNQVASSHHWMEVDGRLVKHSAPYRYIWPSELDLMARLAGFRLAHRWAGWDRSEFTPDSESHVSVYEKAM
jgi:SAM-dependent methyltransferase